MSELYRWTTPISMDRRSLREHLAVGSLVLAEPVGTLTVDRYSDARSDVVYGEYGYGIVAPHLPPGKYLIVEADDD